MEHASPTRIFVYGTLLAGESNHALLARARRVDAAWTGPGFALVDLGPYPGMLREGDGRVFGEVYEIDAPTLADLDRLEDAPRMYRRVRIPLADGREVEAYEYALDASAAPRIEGGDWRRHREERAR